MSILAIIYRHLRKEKSLLKTFVYGFRVIIYETYTFAFS